MEPRILPPETFETARLIGRRPRVEDAPAAFSAYASDPEVTRYLAWRTYGEVAALAGFLRSSLEVWAAGRGHFTWMLCLRGTDAPVGSIGCEISGGKAVFGYVLARQLWGQGLMSEALGTLVNWALAQPAVHRAWAFCDLENPASARVMEKAGMVREGVLRRWHVCPNIGPEPRDCIVCAKVR
jgi:RimJ/RimL family protein N-acetyltransferase